MSSKQSNAGLVLLRWLRAARNQPAGHTQYFDREKYAEAIKRWVADGWCEVVDQSQQPPTVPRTVEVEGPPATRAITKTKRKRKARTKG